VFLGGLVVIVLAIEPRFAGSNTVEEDWFLLAIKISSTTFFGGEVKPSFPYRHILRHVKE
jgi:hypothetical protein